MCDVYEYATKKWWEGLTLDEGGQLLGLSWRDERFPGAYLPHQLPHI